jgi:hypothetical protein
MGALTRRLAAFALMILGMACATSAQLTASDVCPTIADTLYKLAATPQATAVKEGGASPSTRSPQEDGRYLTGPESSTFSFLSDYLNATDGDNDSESWWEQDTISSNHTAEGGVGESSLEELGRWHRESKCFFMRRKCTCCKLN